MVQAAVKNGAKLSMNKKTKPTAQAIYESLKEMIIRFEIAPGSRITETEVSGYFEVSRTPVRAALQRLETEGHLSIKAKQGCFIRNIDLVTINNYYDVRLQLETMALELIDKSHDRKELQTLRNDWNPDQKNFGDQVSDALKAAEETFHIALAEIAGNNVLTQYLKDINEQIRVVRQMGWPDEQSVTDTYVEHYRICQLLTEKNLTAAKEEMEHHIRKSQDLANNISLKQIYGKKSVLGR